MVLLLFIVLQILEILNHTSNGMQNDPLKVGITTASTVRGQQRQGELDIGERCAQHLDQRKTKRLNRNQRRFYARYCKTAEIFGSGGDISDDDLKALGQQIFDADTDRLDVSLNLQGTIQDGATSDAAPKPLFNSIPSGVSSNPLYAKLTALFDNYIRDQTKAEEITPAEWNEVDEFLTAAMDTQALQLTFNFLASKGVLPNDATQFQATLKEIWYSLYERDKALSSSGAEHVQVGEIDGSEISGLHNWVRFALLEQAGSVNYLGYVRILDIGGAYIIRNPFYWDQYYKPIGGFFIGTSPAFDLSVYTLCFYARPNALCNLEVNGEEVQIQTYTMNYSGNTLVGSSYPNY